MLGELAELHALPLIMAQLTGVENLTRSDLNAETTRLSRLARARERYETLPDNPWQGLQGMWSCCSPSSSPSASRACSCPVRS